MIVRYAPRGGVLPSADPGGGNAGQRARQAITGNLGAPSAPAFDNAAAIDISKGLAQVSEIVQRIGFERDSVAAVAAEGRVSVEAQKRVEALNPLAPDYLEQVKNIWADAKKEVLDSSGIKNSLVRDDLSKRMDRHGAAQQMASIGVQKSAVDQEGVRVYKEGVDATVAKIRANPNQADLYVAEFQADAARLRTGIRPEKLPALASVFADAVSTAKIEGYAEKGQLGKARQVLNDERSGLTDAQFTRMSAFIDGKESKMKSDAAFARANLTRAQNENTAQILIDLSDIAAGNKPYTGTERARIEEAHQKGLISTANKLAAVDHLNALEKKQRVEEAKTQDALDRMQNNNLETQEQADRAYRATVGPLRAGAVAQSGSAEQWERVSAISLDIASRQKFLPGDVKNMMETADSTTDKNQAQFVARAAKLADDMDAQGARPHAGVTLSQNGTLAVVRAAVERYMNRGMSPEQAYLEAAKATMAEGALTVQQNKDRMEEVQTRLSKSNVPGEVKTILSAENSIAERNVPFVTAPGIDTAAQAEYVKQLKAAATVTGDPELQKKIAEKALKETYGRSEANGTPSIVAYPPERYFPPAGQFMTPEQRSSYIRKEVEPYIKRQIGDVPRGGGDVNLPGYRVIATEETKRDIQNGVPPRYAVQVRHGDGYITLPDRWRAPTDEQLRKSEEFQRLDQERISAQMKARQIELDKQTGTTDRKKIEQRGRDLQQQYTPQTIPGR
ncbi:MAG: hypothetical protein AB7U76_24500 [Pirellulales bacterium]